MTNKTNQIDLTLSVLCVLADRDETLTTYEIAEICGCSQTYISQVNRSALKKLHNSRLADFK